MESAAFDLPRILRETFVERIEYRDELASTNDLALQLAGTGGGELPLLVLAGRQTGGRGRGANRWWASDGALTFSLLLDSRAADLPPHDWPRISLTTALAAAHTLRQLLPQREVRLKWPNDVYLQRHKVCGILVENAPRQPDRIVIGVGLNVNNSFAAAPPDLQGVGTSLIDAAGAPFDRTGVLIALLDQLATGLATIGAAAAGLADRWRELCLLEGRTVQVAQGARHVVGVCQGIDDEGALLLQTEGGIQRCLAGVVARIY